MVNFDEVRQLEATHIRKNDRWLYSADFNVGYDRSINSKFILQNTLRIDVELEDINYIVRNGGIAVVLAHHGRYRKDVENLEFVIPYLKSKLETDVFYCEDNIGKKAGNFINSLDAGCIGVMGNTRLHEGEEKNDLELAYKFSRLGERIAIGGFGKAHRENASNVGILEYIPGYATRSQIREMSLLSPWAGKSNQYSVAIIGGVKKEKITIGLAGLVESYDCIIPGGIVLNTVYSTQGIEIGNSVSNGRDKTLENIVKGIINGPYSDKIRVPERVIIARINGGTYEDVHEILIDEGVPSNFSIVDFIPNDKILECLERACSEKGRIIMAGTPGIYKDKRRNVLFKCATETVLDFMNNKNVSSALVGGDTVGEIEFKGVRSTGGGSALAFIAYGTTAVFEALRKNKIKFS